MVNHSPEHRFEEIRGSNDSLFQSGWINFFVLFVFLSKKVVFLFLSDQVSLLFKSFLHVFFGLLREGNFQRSGVMCRSGDAKSRMEVMTVDFTVTTKVEVKTHKTFIDVSFYGKCWADVALNIVHNNLLLFFFLISFLTYFIFYHFFLIDHIILDKWPFFFYHLFIGFSWWFFLLYFLLYFFLYLFLFLLLRFFLLNHKKLFFLEIQILI